MISPCFWGAGFSSHDGKLENGGRVWGVYPMIGLKQLISWRRMRGLTNRNGADNGVPLAIDKTQLSSWPQRKFTPRPRSSGTAASNDSAQTPDTQAQAPPGEGHRDAARRGSAPSLLAPGGLRPIEQPFARRPEEQHALVPGKGQAVFVSWSDRNLPMRISLS